jgi:SAM-dependent methyltransferase
MDSFDTVADRYDDLTRENIEFSGLTPDYFDRMKVSLLDTLLSSYTLLKGKKSFTILDFGCGVGRHHALLSETFPQMTLIGCDVSTRSLDNARTRNQHLPHVRYCGIDESGRICLEDKVDLVMVSNVFHHIPFEQHDAVFRSIKDVLKKGGLVFLVEHNPWNPLTQYAVKTCEFDANAQLLSSIYVNHLFRKHLFSKISSGFMVFFPGFLKKLLPFERFLSWCPLGAQHYYLGGL